MNHFKHIIVLILLFSFTFDGFSGKIVLEGSYQNKNIYIQNTFSMEGVGFCTYMVQINGFVCADEINSQAFEIDLEQYKLEIGAPILIEISYKNDGCVPKVLNPNALLPNPTFRTTAIDVDENGLIVWSTANEIASLPYILEQFKWNKWVRVGEVEGLGGLGENSYQFQTTPHAGKNKYRVKQKGYIDKIKYSPSVSYYSKKPETTFIYNKKKQSVEFSEDTSFEVYDIYGDIVKKGHGNHISVANLRKSVYYINFGNTMAEFRRR